jgi:hypothetical protein
MARTVAGAVDTEPRPASDAGPARTANGAHPSASARTPRALALSDSQGRQALVWQLNGAWTVQCEDSAFRQRIRRALKKSVWIREDVAGPDGEKWSHLVELKPDDPRHSRHVLWNWHQLGLRNVDVAVVPAPT